MQKKNTNWSDRENEVYFGGFSNSKYGDQNLAYQYGTGNNCSVCNTTISGTQSYFWKDLKSFKFAFSPYGYEWDCGSTIEILDMGVIPIIPCWAGAYAYRDLPVVVIWSLNEINEKNLNIWSKELGHMMANQSHIENLLSPTHSINQGVRILQTDIFLKNYGILNLTMKIVE
jgi:hypothetical protein